MNSAAQKAGVQDEKAQLQANLGTNSAAEATTSDDNTTDLDKY